MRCPNRVSALASAIAGGARLQQRGQSLCVKRTLCGDINRIGVNHLTQLPASLQCGDFRRKQLKTRVGQRGGSWQDKHLEFLNNWAAEVYPFGD
jgi:hypothetical protein